MDKHITAPFDKKQVEDLHAGDYVYISGVIYSARDAAHKRMYDTLIENENDESKLPIQLEGNVIYYLGPTPARKGQVIGSAGPTTSSRMDKYTPLILSKGLNGMIGKGKSQKRSRQASRLTKGESSCENQTIKVKSAFFFVRFFVSSACLDAQRSCSRWQTVRMLC